MAVRMILRHHVALIATSGVSVLSEFRLKAVCVNQVNLLS